MVFSLLLLLLSISLLFSGQQLIQLQSSLPKKNDLEPVLVRRVVDQGVYVHDMAFSSGSFYSLTENIEDVFFADPFLTNFQNALYMRDSDFSTKWETGLFPTSSETVVNVTTEQIETSRRFTTILACNGDFGTPSVTDAWIELKRYLADHIRNGLTDWDAEFARRVGQLIGLASYFDAGVDIMRTHFGVMFSAADHAAGCFEEDPAVRMEELFSEHIKMIAREVAVGGR